MAINSKHPKYSEFDQDWVLCRDSYQGERIVKSKGTTYLSPTAGHRADGMLSSLSLNTNSIGFQAYEAYKEKAVFHDFMKTAVETYMGIMWSKPPVIELPKQLEAMFENATIQNENLFQLLRRINEQQLITGRVGLLLDLPTTPQPFGTIPYIALYEAENILNWDDGQRNEVAQDSLNLVVLDESEYQRNADFNWEWKNKYRTLVYGEVFANEKRGTAAYSVGVFEDVNAMFDENSLKTPLIAGKTLDKIPFTFINSKDIVASPDSPPLVGLARLGLTIYRGEADYRQSLHLQGQDTLVVIGSSKDEAVRVGAGAALVLPAGGDAKFIGVNSAGLTEQRESLDNDKTVASNKAGQLIDTRSKQKESGVALTKRISAQTATLTQIALAGAGGLEKILRFAAEWVGANPDDVVVTPNLDFVDDKIAAKELVEYMTAKSLGAPISKRTIHLNMQNKGLTELNYEEELAAIEEETPELEGVGIEDAQEESQ